ncbi:MAG: TA system VapC family ribonuclease toxin [Burkholderiales bacterium]
MTPDVNVLVAGFRADHSHDETARAWLTKARRNCLQGSESLTVLPMVMAGFVRLVTNRRVFVDPDSVEDAIAFIDAVLESPGVHLAACGQEWPLLRNKLLTLRLHGNLVTDAWIASAVETLGEHLVTFDHDFKRLLPARDFTLLG